MGRKELLSSASCLTSDTVTSQRPRLPTPSPFGVRLQHMKFGGAGVAYDIHVQPILRSKAAQGPEAPLQAAGHPLGFSQHSRHELHGDPKKTVHIPEPVMRPYLGKGSLQM